MARTMNIFIAVPTARREMKDIEKDCQRVLEAVKKTTLVKGYTDFKVIPDYLEYGSEIEQLGNSISQLDDADLVIFAHGWDTVPECFVIRTACRKYYIEYCYEDCLD